ncbi:aspartate/glutamate racemase family protein [Aquabacterium sp.]|uniref:aspartate/glutamate racemase family protein n=1 Tax=Aquabacterium sp. TaxID=1872578 RepID=UPI003D6CEBA7
MHVLIINPNMRAELTDELVKQLTPFVADRGVDVIGTTATFGNDYIASEASYVMGAHAVLDAWHLHLFQHGQPQAVLVACFGDPGVWALREITGVPVIGLAEASMQEANAIGPFGIVTGGAAWGPMLERLARGWDMSGPAGLQRVLTVEAHGGELAADPTQGASSLNQAVTDILAQAPALKAVILGGAALGGWADKLPAGQGTVLIDSVAAGGRWLAAAVA